MKVYIALIQIMQPTNTTADVKAFATEEKANEWASKYTDYLAEPYSNWKHLDVRKARNVYSINTHEMNEYISIDIIEQEI